MKRWLVLTLGLGVAAIAGLSLLVGGDFGTRRGSGAKGERPHASAAGGHDEIDDASRDQLRAILREAEREEADAP